MVAPSINRTDPVFALRIDAAADEGNVFPKGKRRPMLIMIRAPNVDYAVEAARDVLSFHHWCEATLLSTGEVTLFGEAVEDLKLRQVVDYAREHGSGILVYDD